MPFRQEISQILINVNVNDNYYCVPQVKNLRIRDFFKSRRNGFSEWRCHTILHTMATAIVSRLFYYVVYLEREFISVI